MHTNPILPTTEVIRSGGETRVGNHMHMVTFTVGPLCRLGVLLLLEDKVIDLQAAYIALLEYRGGGPLNGATRALAMAQVPAEAVSFIEVGSSALEAAKQVLVAVRAGSLADATSMEERVSYSLDEVRLRAPLQRPGKIIAIGLNYSDHAAESNMAIPKYPVLFAKFATCLVGPNEPVVHPGSDITTQLDYEVELAFIIGRKGRHIPESEAMEYVFGYSVMNDVSARDLQFEDGQWLKGKALDTFAPFGPAIVTRESVPDPHSLNLKLTLNGTVMQNSNTRHLIFPVPYLVSYLSRLMTLEPGDVVTTGTPPGVGFSRKPPVFLKPGDTMIAEIEGIGSLVTPIVAARS